MEQLNVDNSNENVEILDLNVHETIIDKKSTNNMKKTHKPLTIIIVIFVFVGLGLAYYYINRTNTKYKFLEKKMKVASSDYFKKYTSTNDSSSAYIVTLNMLKKANENGEKYDLKGLENCKANSTLSIITINYKDGTPKKVEVKLNC